MVDDIHVIWENHDEEIYIWQIHNSMYKFQIIVQIYVFC